MDKDEALKLALEALESSMSDDKPYIVQSKKAITAIKEVFAQPEPVQVSINHFVTVVKGKEDWVGRPVYWAQWPNEEKSA